MSLRVKISLLFLSNIPIDCGSVPSTVSYEGGRVVDVESAIEWHVAGSTPFVIYQVCPEQNINLGGSYKFTYWGLD